MFATIVASGELWLLAACCLLASVYSTVYVETTQAVVWLSIGAVVVAVQTGAMWLLS